MNLVSEVKELGENLLMLYAEEEGISVDELSDLERQIIFIYLFGMANGIREEKYGDYTPLLMEADMTAVLITVFHHPPELAQGFMGSVIFSLQSSEPSTIKSIIHKGLDGYFMWKEDRKADVLNEIVHIADVCKNQ